MAHEEGGLGHWFQEHIAEFNPFLGLNPYEAHSFISWVGEWGISRGLVISLFFVGLLFILSIEIPNLPLFALGWLAGTAPIWIPIALWVGAWKAWINYARARFLATRNPIVLEVKIPREITKSPRAMELVFANLYVSSGEVSFMHRAWGGSVRPWFSFEIASFGGEIHFYIWCWKTYRRVIETSVYGQYPDVEITEVEDYMSRFNFDPDKYTCRVGDYIFKNPDHFPIKSYIDFELDKDPKEEFLIDPLSSVFETLSNLKPTEQVWIQMNFRINGSNGVLIRKKDDWVDRVKKAVDVIRLEMVIKEDPEDRGFPRPTWRQTETIMAMERHLGKTPFDVGLRFIYISEGELHGPTFTAIRWIYKLYNSPNYLNLIRSGRGHDPFDFPWQDYHSIRWNLVTRRHIDAMRRRSYFYTPWTTPHIVMSPELMASLYHYPSGAIKAPGLQRIPSLKSEPPANLPR